jgi:hypothetical protein
MSLAFWFWLFMVLWFVFGAILRYRVPVVDQPYYYWFGGHLLEFFLLAIIGWKVFGSPFDTLVTR